MTPPNSSLDAQPVIDPDTAAVLAAARAATPPNYEAIPLAEGRRIFHELGRGWNEPAPPLPVVQEMTLPGPAGTLKARLYAPRSDAALPVLLYLHGGGWTYGSIDSHDRFARLMAQDAGIAVLSLDYRLAPEAPFPAPRDDALAAFAWLEQGKAGALVDATRIAIGGDSAGANLALATTLARRDARAALPRTAVLVYGCYAPSCDSESNRRFGGGDYLLTTARMRWYWKNYLGRDGEAAVNGATPLRVNLAGLPPLYLNAAGLDPLLDDSLELARRLAAAGVPYRLDVHPGVVHGFMQQTAKVARARAALAAIVDHLKRALA
jgi:acetyl esterase